MWLYYSILSAFFFYHVSAHTIHFGRTCPNVQPFPNLAVDKILGTWFVLHKTDTDNNCLVWNLTRGAMPDSLKVTETRQLSVLDVFRVDHTHAITARIDIPNPEVPGKMRIRWPTLALTGKADFIVFDTDYETYMAIFECDRAGFLHRRSAAILSRTQDIDENMVKRVRRLLETADVGHYYLSEISHDACRVEGKTKWHIDREFFGLAPGEDAAAEVMNSNKEVTNDYDITQLEIVEEEANPSYSFRGSLREGRPDI
uniref:Lipocalin-like protein 3 n=1 Tax=Palaemon carinicauda TaxID=392227 RepID=A0A5B8TYL3_PALCI|nr:lipocalin-like protein 3 [Palaemon carinicauda]